MLAERRVLVVPMPVARPAEAPAASDPRLSHRTNLKNDDDEAFSAA
jgi:hypothetical protein